MSFSRRMFLRTGLFSAAACASLPFSAVAGTRRLPVDTDLPHAGASSGNSLPATGSHSLPPIADTVSPMSREFFEDAVGSAFHVRSGSGEGSPFWLRLLSVKDFPAPPPVDPAAMAVPPPPAALNAAATVSFSLAFSGGPLPEAAQGTYLFKHVRMGEFALFIAPSGPQQYTAVVNWLKLGTVKPV